jgi:DNA repair protein RadC
MILKSQLLSGVFVANEQGHYSVKRPITSDEIVEVATTLLGQRFLKTICLNKPTLTQDFMEAQLPKGKLEAFYVMFLNEDYRIVGYEHFYTYIFESSTRYLREMMKLAFDYSATQIVVGHRHSSEESDLITSSDIDIVRTLDRILPEFDMKLLDYIVRLDTTVASYFQPIENEPYPFEGRYPSTGYEYQYEDGCKVP